MRYRCFSRLPRFHSYFHIFPSLRFQFCVNRQNLIIFGRGKNWVWCGLVMRRKGWTWMGKCRLSETRNGSSSPIIGNKNFKKRRKIQLRSGHCVNLCRRNLLSYRVNKTAQRSGGLPSDVIMDSGRDHDFMNIYDTSKCVARRSNEN